MRNQNTAVPSIYENSVEYPHYEIGSEKYYYIKEYKDDFKDVKKFINTYKIHQLDEKKTIKYYPYNWKLNDLKEEKNKIKDKKIIFFIGIFLLSISLIGNFKIYVF